jgi:hypothetical protein
MTDDVQVWTYSLDSLAALIDRQRLHVDGQGRAALDEWNPPASPLPAELRPRALLLRHDTEALRVQVQRRLVGAPDPRRSPYT